MTLSLFLSDPYLLYFISRLRLSISLPGESPKFPSRFPGICWPICLESFEFDMLLLDWKLGLSWKWQKVAGADEGWLSANAGIPLDKKEWKDATCSVCIEYPHNAVLLLCSSYDKGCRPYMCGTSFRYSNCLDQYKKAYTKVTSPIEVLALEVPDSSLPVVKCTAAELACPLCRGQVKGWTVVEPAREYLNLKKRSCMHEDCPFVGNYKELRKHVRAKHPSARPREVDPALEQKWRRLEREHEHNDVVSTIRSTMPGAMVFGDYVIEGNNYGLDSEDEDDDAFDADPAGINGGLELGLDSNLMNVFFLLHAFGQSGNVGRPGNTRRAFGHNAVSVRHASPVVGIDSTDEDDESDSDDSNGSNMSLVNRLRQHGRVLLGRSGRRRRQREANGGQR